MFGKVALAFGAAIAVVAIAVVVANAMQSDGETSANARSIDEAPPEYVYLDTARVLAYLGQIEGGLTSAEKRRVEETAAVSGKLTLRALEAGASNQRVGSVEQDVTASATSRFYRLLAWFIGSEEGRRWLVTVDAAAPDGKLSKQLRNVEVGSFVRLKNAQLSVAPFMGVYARTAYSRNYLVGNAAKPRRPLFERGSARTRLAAHRYRKAVRRNPRIPMVVALSNSSTEEQPTKFVVPVRYSGLTREASSLAGETTIVGKVVYMDQRQPSEVSEDDPPPEWTHLETVRRFAPALKSAELPLLRLLRLEGKNLPDLVRRYVTFRSPVIVVLPVALYQ